MFLNLQKLCEKTKQNVFNIVPITFTIDVLSSHLNYDLSSNFCIFKQFFKILNSNKKIASRITSDMKLDKKFLHTTKIKLHKNESKLQKVNFVPVNFDKIKETKYTKFTMPASHFKGYKIGRASCRERV